MAWVAQNCPQGKDNCNVSYTLGKQANYVTYPLDYQRGELMAIVIGIGSTARLVWTNPAGTAMTLVSQINVNEAGEGRMALWSIGYSEIMIRRRV